MKYERLVKLHQESLESFAAASKSAEIHQNGMLVYHFVNNFCFYF